MASFVKLLKGGRDAVRKAQQEFDQAKIEEKLAFKDAPGALTLYHGSPHPFDEFDFEQNLRRGEGAMAYGPGGYMTGNRPLAEHYARTLFQRHTGTGLYVPSDPLNQKTGGRKIARNLGALNRYFLETDGQGLARDAAGELFTARYGIPNYGKVGKYGLSMDSSLDPFTGTVFADSQFLPGQKRAPGRSPYHWDPDLKNTVWDAGPGSPITNSHGTLSGMLGEDKNATLRYLQFKEAVRAMDRGIVDDTTGASLLRDIEASPGWKHYIEATDGAWPVPPTARGGKSDWRLTPQNSDWAMKVGEELNRRLDPHNDLRLRVKRGPIPVAVAKEDEAVKNELAPWLYTANYGAGPNEMLLYDLPMKDQSSRVRGALQDLFDNATGLSRRKLADETMGHEAVKALPQDVRGMLMLRDAGIPATAYLRAGPRNGGVREAFHPSDYNFVIHDQSLLDDVSREKLK